MLKSVAAAAPSRAPEPLPPPRPCPGRWLGATRSCQPSLLKISQDAKHRPCWETVLKATRKKKIKIK